MMRNIYSTVCHCLPKLFQITRYGMIKLSKWNITQQTALKIFTTISFLSMPNHFEQYYLKMAWIQRRFSSIMAFQTHPLIQLNSTNSMALSKTQFFSSDYVWNQISHVIISSHCNKSVNIYFINDLRQKKNKKFSVQYHLNLVLKMQALYHEFFLVKNRRLTTHIKSADHHPVHTS